MDLALGGVCRDQVPSSCMVGGWEVVRRAGSAEKDTTGDKEAIQ